MNDRMDAANLQPLHGYERIALAGERATLYFCETPPDAKALEAIGLLAVAPDGDLSGADLAPLKGRLDVACVTASGGSVAKTKATVEALAPLTRTQTVSQVSLPPTPAAWIEEKRAAGMDDATIARAIGDMSNNSEPLWNPADEAPAPPTWQPFPTELFPDVLARFIRESADAIGCDESMVALPVLVVCATAIGNARTIELKKSWHEPSVLWAAVVARSGSKKSVAFDAAVKPLRKAQFEALQAHREAMRHHEQGLREYEQLDKAGKAKRDKPQPPTPVRYIASDTTTEALAAILEQNWRGVGCFRDEAVAVILGFNQYKSRGGADAACWLELHRAGPLIIDRKTGERRTIVVRRAAVSLCGTTQPGRLSEALTDEHWVSGLAARMLMLNSPEPRMRWSDRTPTRAAVDNYASLIDELLRIRPATDDAGEPMPLAMPLTTDALALWVGWYDHHADRQADAATDRDAAALAKIEGYAARFALVFALAENPDSRVVDLAAMDRGTALAEWFTHETARIYGELAAIKDTKGGEQRELVRWIERRGGHCTPRELARTLRRYPKVADAEAALDELVEAGMGYWTAPGPGRQGGRPSKVFILTGPADNTPPETPDSDTPADETTDTDSTTRGFVGVGTVGTPESGNGELTYTELPVEAILPGRTARKELGDSDTLAESIRTVGLMNRIVVGGDYMLIAGYRRLDFRTCNRLPCGDRRSIEARGIPSRALLAQAAIAIRTGGVSGHCRHCRRIRNPRRR